MRNISRIGTYFLALLGFMFAGFLCFGQLVSAEPLPENYYLAGDASSLKRESAVNDFAGIYTLEQISAFETEMQKMRDEYDCNVMAFIIDNDEWNSSEQSAPENVSEMFLPLDDHKSTVVLWLNVCRENRSLYILGYGSAEHKITSSEADDIAYDLQSYVKEQQSSGGEGNEKYVEMMESFIHQADAEMRRPYFFLSWWFHLAIGVVVALIVVLVLIHNTAGKMTTSGKTYINQAFSQVIGRQDIYTHTTYVRTKKSSSSSSGGGGGGGHSHSSGGGRF